jgi:glycosyltransferase involved in cell wall biosynthesis
MARYLSEIILTTYNSSAHIRECLESILPQLSNDVRLYIVDDSSNDDTAFIVRSLIESHASYSPFVTFKCNQVNRGLTYILHHYLRQNRSKYVFRMDSDDICHPCRFREQLGFALLNPTFDVIGSHAIEIDQASRIIGLKVKPLTHERIVNSLYINPFIHSSVIFKADSVVSAGNYNLAYRHGQDYELWFRCYEANHHFHNINKPLVYLRKSPRSKYSVQSYILEFTIALNGCIKCSQPPISYLMIFLRLIYSLVWGLLRK